MHEIVLHCDGSTNHDLSMLGLGKRKEGRTNL